MTNECKQVKAYLNRLRDILRDATRLEYRINSLRTRCEHITQVLSDMPKTHGNNGNYPWDDLADLTVEYKKELEHESEVSKEISRAINLLEDVRQKQILEMRYLHMATWTTIAEVTNYDLRYVYRLHDDALKALIPLIDLPIAV